MPDDLVEDGMTGYLGELMEACNMLDARFDDINSGRVQRVDDDEACLQLRQKSQNRSGSWTGFERHPDALRDS